jgi:2-oxoisovalerate dehydrogenase E2 component (dihydrolipoyl transacylase)
MSRFVFKLPDVGEGVAEAEVVAWHVAVGDVVAEDQPLADVMTDKATVELTSPAAGVVVERHGAEGELLAVGSPLVVLETEAVAEAPADTAPPPAAEPAAAAPAAAAGKALAAPAVRERAKTLGLDVAAIAGSGPDGRVTHADLDAALAGGARPAPLAAAGYARREGVADVKVIGLRRRIAENMQAAKRRIPHFTYVEEIDVTELEDLRAHLNRTHGEARAKLSLPPFLMRALVQALPRWPQINATFDDEAGVVHRHAGVHIGVATQTRDGLMVPVVRHAETLDLWATAGEVARLAAAARVGKAAREDLSGSTITLTSLGALGGVATTPVINAPEVAIIGPNRIVERPVVRGGHIVVRKMMNLSSAFDHRVVDGYDAAEFIQALKAMLEHPATLFVT